MAGRGGRRARVVVVGALVLASCSSDEGAEPAPPELSVEPLESTSSTQIVSDPTSPATTPATVAPVETPASSSSTSTEPPASTTEPAPPTTTLDDLRAEIEADLNEAEIALFSAFGAPSSVEARRGLEKYFGAGALMGFLSRLDSLVESNRYARQADDLASSTTVYEVVSVEDDQAVISRCRIDAGVVFEVDGNGEERIIDDSVIKYVTLSEVQLVDGVWRLNGGSPVSESEGVETCEL